MTSNMEASVQHRVLRQGARLATVARPGAKSFHLVLALPVGWKNDPAGLEGAAHFLEHLTLYRGGDRPIIEELASHAVRCEGRTSHNVTEYEFAGHVKFLPRVLEFLSGVLAPLDCDQGDVDAERRIIAQELAERELKPTSKRQAALNRHWDRLRGYRSFEDVDSQRDALPRMSVERLRDHHATTYSVAKSAIALWSPWEHAEAVRRLESQLEGAMTPATLADLPTLTPTRDATPLVTFSYDWGASVWVVVNAVTCELSPKMDLVAAAIDHQLGGGSHAIMQQEFQRRGARAYRASTHAGIDGEFTWFSATVSVARKEAQCAAEWIFEQFSNFANQGPCETALKQQADRLKLWSETILDLPERVTGVLATQALRGGDNWVTPAELAEIATRLSADEARELSEQLLAPERLALFVGGPVGWRGRRQLRRLLERR